MSCNPRFGTPRRDRPTRGPLVGRVAELLGWELYDWQRHAADVSLEYDPATRVLCYRTVGISVARQNGKTTLVCARIALQLTRPNARVAYTAQDRNLARVKWEEHVELLMATPFAQRVRKVDRVNGRESLVMRNGARYGIVTPNEKAGRSLTLDLAVIDEAFAHPDDAVVGALKPTMSARRSAQLWLLSNAGDHRSGLWRHYTDLGRDAVQQLDSPLCWLEWAAPDGCELTDVDAWRAANPTLDRPTGVQSAALTEAAATMRAETFRREHLNVWPDMTHLVGVDPLAWAACRDDDALIGDDVVLSVEFTPERDRGSIVAAGLLDDGRVAIEIVDVSSDVDALVRRAVDVAARWSAPVALDRGGPAGSTVAAFERAGVELRLIALPDLVKACGDLHDAVAHGTLAHRGDYRLSDAVAAATKRSVGDAWVWRRRGGADITSLVAATIARWGVLTRAEPLVPAIY